ncbi:MAG: hypothetical protein J0H74_10225 [Chitinophagaceae bacterium]|nr:hypothetical protein [Chitinophagaceae bacterium]
MKITARLISLVSYALFIFPNLQAQSYGLLFQSREVVAEKRTAFDLTPDDSLCYARHLSLSFDISFNPVYPTYFGYIFRIINDKSQNVDLLYDQKNNQFRIIFLDSYTSVSLPVTVSELVNRWHRLRLDIDEQGITFYHDGRQAGKASLKLGGNCLRICFGANSYAGFKSIDVPAILLKDVGLKVDDNKEYFWSLDESTGTNIADSLSSRKAVALNPAWIKPRHSNWELVSSMLIKGYPSTAFDGGEDRLFIVARDSLYTLSMKTGVLSATMLSVRQDNLLLGNQSVFNPYNRELYNFYIDEHIVTAFNFSEARWDQHFAPAPVTEYWHVNKFFSKSDSALYVLDGYGQLRYKNKVQRYGLGSRKWAEVATGGDYYTPRYLAGLGTTGSGDTAYILGGYGSKDGDQLLNPKYLYELSLFDVRTRSFKKLYSLKEPAEPFVFANSLVIDETGKSYYTLVFSKDKFNTQLQLMKGSLEKPVFTFMASPFPYSFADNRSFADLYYSPATQSLLAVTLYANSDNYNTEVKIYRISCPPNQQYIQTASVKGAGRGWYWYVAAGLLGIGVGVFFLRKRVKVRSSIVEPIEEKTKDVTSEVKVVEAIVEDGPKARICFFGNFEVTGSNGEDLTKLFTPLLKELFLLLAMDSIRWGKGVSAEKINETLWNDRNVKDAINNRSVNIAKLKNILERVGGCTISKASGYWKLDLDDALVRVDFARYVHIFSEPVRQKASMDELISIVHRGPFLPQADYPWLDNIKSEVSNFIIDALLKYCASLSLQENAENIITICDSIFFFDESNEIALRFKCKGLIALGRHALAKNTFEKFNARYREIYGEGYHETYAALIGA